MGNFCLSAEPLKGSSLLTMALRGNEEMPSDLLSATHAGYMFATPIFIRCNCSTHTDVVPLRVGTPLG